MSAYNKLGENDDEYSFIQEHVMPRTKNTKKKYIRYLCVTVVLGIVFGIVSSVVFSITNHFIGEKKEEPPKPISLEATGEHKDGVKPQATDNSKIQETEPLQDSKTKKHLSDEEISRLMGIKSYQRLYSLMKELADEKKHSMVSVLSVSEAASWFNVENTETSYGLIIKIEEDSIYVMCNYNDVRDVSKIRVEFYNEEVVKAQLMDYDKLTSLAILKIRAKLITQSTLKRIEEIGIGDSYQLAAGSPVLGLGAPDGLVKSMQFGYVTAEGIDRYVVDGKLCIYHTSIAENPFGEGFFVDMNGRLIGFITHSFKEEEDANSMCFLGISKLRPIIEDMLNQREAAYLGVKVCDMSSDDVEKLNVHFGIYVTDVVAKSPAFRAGLKSGDVITAIDGTSVSSVAALMTKLGDKEPGDEMDLTITRQKRAEYPKLSFQEKRIKVVLGES